MSDLIQTHSDSFRLFQTHSDSFRLINNKKMERGQFDPFGDNDNDDDNDDNDD